MLPIIPRDKTAHFTNNSPVPVKDMAYYIVTCAGLSTNMGNGLLGTGFYFNNTLVVYPWNVMESFKSPSVSWGIIIIAMTSDIFMKIYCL